MSNTLRRRNLKVRNKGISDRDNVLKEGGFAVRDGRGRIIERWKPTNVDEEYTEYEITYEGDTDNDD